MTRVYLEGTDWVHKVWDFNNFKMNRIWCLVRFKSTVYRGGNCFRIWRLIIYMEDKGTERKLDPGLKRISAPADVAERDPNNPDRGRCSGTRRRRWTKAESFPLKKKQGHERKEGTKLLMQQKTWSLLRFHHWDYQDDISKTRSEDCWGQGWDIRTEGMEWGQRMEGLVWSCRVDCTLRTLGAGGRGGGQLEPRWAEAPLECGHITLVKVGEKVVLKIRGGASRIPFSNCYCLWVKSLYKN